VTIILTQQERTSRLERVSGDFDGVLADDLPLDAEGEDSDAFR
jgi:hypothetical protein